MKIVSIGGGPAGLYFAALMKQADPTHQIRVLERNRGGETFGFGVVFSDATLGNLRTADPETYAEIEAHFAHWDDIETHVGGQCIRSTGHGFCGLERRELLAILQRRCADLGVELVFETEVRSVAEAGEADLILAADGVASTIRTELAEHFEPDIDERPNRFVWLGTTVPFGAFTFIFKEDEAGLWRVHAYRYKEAGSTFIVETTEDTWRRAGLDQAGEDATLRYLEGLFADELGGHRLVKNRSIWRSFPTVHNRRWHHGNVVLMGDAAHTAHFSIGSGTKLAMEDAIALRDALAGTDGVEPALARYERARRPEVEKLQRAAQVSLEWFENTERYTHFEPRQLTFSLLTRSLRVTHDNLRQRDAAFVADYDRWFARRAGVETGAGMPPVAPMFLPLELRGQTLSNRVVSPPMALDAAHDGAPGDAYLVHAGTRAAGGCGLVFAGTAAVSPDGRVTPRSAGLYREDHVASWERIALAVMREPGARPAIRLAHAGPRGGVECPWPGRERPLADGWELVAASARSYGEGRATPRAASSAEVDGIVDAFARAAERATRAGFGLVELDFAGGGLVASFLSPLTNHRDDELGGDAEGRSRLAERIVAAVRGRVDDGIAVLVRLCADDNVPGGLRPADASHTATRLVAAGADAITVTAGEGIAGAARPEQRAYSVILSDQVRNDARVVTVAEGGITSSDDMRSAIAAGRADLCAVERLLLVDPYFPRRAARAFGMELPWPEAYHRARGFWPRD